MDEDAAGEYDELRFSLFDACHILLTIVTALLTFVGNGLMVVVIVRTRTLRLPQGYMLLSIAAADLMLGVESLMGFLNVILEHWPDALLGCLIMGYATSVAITVNIFTLAFMSIDRWLVIHRPFHYDALMPASKVLAINTLLWFVSIAFFTPFLFTDVGYEYYADIHICAMSKSEDAVVALVVTSIARLPPLFVIVVFTVLTCRTAHTHAQRIHALEANSAGSRISDASAQQPSNKHIKTSLIIILVNTSTWLPLYVTQILSVAVPSVEVPSEVLFVVSWLLSSSSYINWLICMLTDTPFRAATKSLFHDLRLALVANC
jgi:hypothetical protein